MVSTSNNSSSKSKPTVPVKSTVQTTRNTRATQNIYNKPLKTTKPKIEGKKETRLENIDLNIDKSNQNPKNENKSVNRNENIDQIQTEKIVVSEKDPIFITTRNGKRVQGDYEHYQKTKKEEPRILRIRRRLSKIEENNKGNDKAITTFFAKKQKASPFHVQNVIEQGKANILNQKGSYTFAEDSFTDKFSAGIAQLPYFNEGLKIENERYEAILKEINGREAIKNAAIQKQKEAAWMPKEQRNSVENKYVSFMRKEGVQKRDQEVESQEIKEIAWIHPESRTKEQSEIVSKIEKVGGNIKEKSQVYAMPTNKLVYLSEEQQIANAKYIQEYLTNEGWTLQAISGLFGNIAEESHFNPGQWQYNGPAYGLVQWDPSSKFLEYSNLSGEEADYLAKNNPRELMDMQLDYLVWSSKSSTSSNMRQWFGTNNYNSPENMNYEEYINSTLNAGEMALIFHASYERSNDTEEMAKEREEIANQWYEFFIKN